MEKEHTERQAEVIVKFKKPLSYYEISKLLGDSIVECNKILSKERKKIPFLKRIFIPSDIYLLNRDMHHYFSHDGIVPMQRGGPYLLNSEE